MNNKIYYIIGIAGLSLILCSVIFGNKIASLKQKAKTIQVTGIAEKTFESDLIVWSASFNTQNMDLKTAFANLEIDRQMVMDFFAENGLDPKLIELSSIKVNKQYETEEYNGRYVNTFSGYQLTQTLKIESNDIEKIEQISRNVTEIIKKGVLIESNEPKYYYTKLDDLKIEMLKAASADAYNRATVIAEGSKTKVKKLAQSQMGVFQIIGYNSNEDYSWGGTFNTSSKKKTGSITVKSTFEIY